MKRALVALTLAFALEMHAAALVQPGLATVRVDVPSVLLFQVTNVDPGQATVSPAFRVTFNQAKLPAGQALRISVKAEGSLVLPGGVPVPASSFTWTTSQVVNGVGMNGTLSAATYTPVFESRTNPSAGRLDLTWSMSLPAGVTTAGSGQMNLRWRFEAITP